MDDPIKQRITALKEEIVTLRRDFHMYPELGFKEFRTAEKIEQYLQQLGYETRRVAGTGVVALLENPAPSPVLMLRADMDALPVTEENDVSYRSRNAGVMHACGHDAHMAARVLMENRNKLAGPVKLVFQPNEEIAGAADMIADGVLENPEVDAAMGIHIWSPLPSGTVSVTQGVVMGGLDVFRITVSGRGGHTGYPHKAVDPVIAAAAVVQSVQTIQTREIDCQKPTLIMFGKIQGGTKANIIPEKVELEGSIRFLHKPGEDSGVTPAKRFEQVVKDVCRTYNCRCDIEMVHENIPLSNEEKMTDLARETALAVLGDRDKIVSGRYIASEDFSEYADRVPAVFLFLGCGSREMETDIPHHCPRFNIDEDVLPTGVELYVKGAVNFFNTTAKP